MKDQNLNSDQPMDDAVLQSVLQRYDPVVRASELSLAALERDIFAKIDRSVRVNVLPFPHESKTSMSLLSAGWTGRVVACASLLVIISGFIVGHFSYDEVGSSFSDEAPMLLAFSDEPLMHYIPLTYSSLRDTHDDSE